MKPFYGALLAFCLCIVVIMPAFSTETSIDDMEFPEPILGAMPVKEQVKLAFAIYEDMAETEMWNTDFFKTSHYKVITDCPDTRWAVESCWRLSNLILTAPGEDDIPEVIRLMEYALDTYPGNPWQRRFENRILSVLQDNADFERLLYWSHKLLESADPDSERYLSLALTAAQAALGNNDRESANWYLNEIISRDPDQSTLFGQLALTLMN